MRFCDDESDIPGEDVSHNAAAQTQQNKACDGRSVMGTIRDLLPQDWERRYQGTETEVPIPCESKEGKDKNFGSPQKKIQQNPPNKHDLAPLPSPPPQKKKKKKKKKESHRSK